MMRWLANNAGLLILAVLLAFAAWVVSSWQEDPIAEQDIAARVVVYGFDTGSTSLLSSSVPTSVTTHIRAPQSVLQRLAQDGVNVGVDLSGLEEGRHELVLTPTLAIQPALLLSSSPMTAVVQIERMIRVEAPISLTLTGQPAAGYRMLSTVIQPDHVVITAPHQIISQVASVGVQVDVEGLRSSTEQSVRVLARDANGQTIGTVLIHPEFVNVRLSLEQLSNFSSLAVVPRTEGQPAAGYAVTNISTDPTNITVFGAPDATKTLKGFIETQSVSLNDATADVEQRVSLITPPNISVVGGDLTVLVKIKVAPILSARTVTRKPEIVGLAKELTATVSPATIDIVLQGPLSQLNGLRDEDVRVVVDANTLQPGVNQQVTPKIIAPDGITSQSVLPATIQVEISKRK